MKLLALFFIFFTGFSLPAAAQQPCGIEIACPLGDRSYHIRAPQDWDGKTALPVLLHFHGWGRQGDLIMKHQRIAGATEKLGVLLIAPNGRGRSWSMWQTESPDIDFTNRVLEDAAKRYPIDPDKVIVSGYSYGGIMAWRYACAEGAKLRAVLAISGSVEDPDLNCKSAVEMRHVHGTSDTVMSYPYGPAGTVESAVEYWRTKNGCPVEPSSQTHWQAVEILPFVRFQWNSCTSGKALSLDVHQRGHFIPRFWIERQLQELLGSES